MNLRNSSASCVQPTSARESTLKAESRIQL
jgi:hypothetical protein